MIDINPFEQKNHGVQRTEVNKRDDDMTDVINIFMERYNKEFDFYFNLAKKVEDELGQHLRDSGVRCIVSSRAKSPERLKVKVSGRHAKKPYADINAVYGDIVDLSGVRVALYFPGNMSEVDKIVRDIFSIEAVKKFPETTVQSTSTGDYEKVFSGYNATHYRVRLKGDSRYADTHPVEIQVASVLMHAWSEVEHDLVYKPLQGNLTREELMILDEINGLVLTGNLALERLQQAGYARTHDQNYEFKNHYDLASYFLNQKSSVMTEGVNFRDIFKLLRIIGRTKRSDLVTLFEWMESNRDRLDNLKFRPPSIDPLVKQYIKAVYAIVVLFNSDVISALTDYYKGESATSDLTEGLHKRILVSLLSMFETEPEYKNAGKLLSAYNLNYLTDKADDENALSEALKSSQLMSKMDGGKLIEDLERCRALRSEIRQGHFTPDIYDEMASLLKHINAMIQPAPSPRPRPRRIRNP